MRQGRAIGRADLGVVNQRGSHFLHGRHFDLADAFGADAVFGSQIMQRHAT